MLNSEAEDRKALDSVGPCTFRIEYSPNCPMPFLVRFVGKGQGQIRGDEQDIIGYGMTLAEAIYSTSKARGQA